MFSSGFCYGLTNHIIYCIEINKQRKENKMTNNKYNGWTNYETWNCKLWLDNDEATYNRVINHIDFLLVSSDENLTKEENCDQAINSLTSFLSDMVLNEQPELEASMYSDMLNASLREINFYEIAESYLDDYTFDRKVA